MYSGRRRALFASVSKTSITSSSVYRFFISVLAQARVEYVLYETKWLCYGSLGTQAKAVKIRKRLYLSVKQVPSCLARMFTSTVHLESRGVDA